VTSPVGQVHTPLVQVSPAGHASPHAPQWLGLLAGFTQPVTPPQLMSPVGQAQTPALQAAPGGHLLPQPPQLLLSVCSLTQPRTLPQ
jgi:hypothetical protein